MNAFDPNTIDTAPANDAMQLTGDMPEETVEELKGLGFTDGFQFGCGFWVAGVVVAVGVILLAIVLSFLLSALGIQVLF